MKRTISQINFSRNYFSRKQFPVMLISLATLGMCSVMGCHRKPVIQSTPAETEKPSASLTKETATAAPLTSEDLKKGRPNEAGKIPIIEYHHIEAGTPRQIKTNMFRSPTDFRHDLERLYKEGYRPVSMGEYLDNKIDIPYGLSPVILTFDDALSSQFKYLPDGSIDPNCAVGIMQAFNKEHTDFPLKGTFFVLPRSGFGPPFSEASKKMQALLAMGFDLGNHTINHPILRGLSDEKVQWEIETCAEEIKKLAPKAKVDTLALPYGVAPRNKALELSGSYKGETYKNRAVLLNGAEPARMPFSKKFDRQRIHRILAVEGTAGITFWLDQLKPSNSEKYVSDGDPGITTIPKNLESKIDKSKLNGAILRTY